MGQKMYTIDAYLSMERGGYHAIVADCLLQLGAAVHDIDDMPPFDEKDDAFHVVIIDNSPESFATCIEHFQMIGKAAPIIRCESRLDPIKIARGLQQGISSFVRYPPNAAELRRGIELAHGRIDDANRRDELVVNAALRVEAAQAHRHDLPHFAVFGLAFIHETLRGWRSR